MDCNKTPRAIPKKYEMFSDITCIRGALVYGRICIYVENTQQYTSFESHESLIEFLGECRKIFADELMYYYVGQPHKLTYCIYKVLYVRDVVTLHAMVNSVASAMRTTGEVCYNNRWNTYQVVFHKAGYDMAMKIKRANLKITKVEPELDEKLDLKLIYLANTCSEGIISRRVYNKAKYDRWYHTNISMKQHYGDACGREYLYLIGCDPYDGFAKIGHTTNVMNRLTSLQTGHRQTLKILHYVPHTYAFILEKRLHELYAKRRVQGEWFQFEESELPGVVASFPSSG